MRFSTVRCGIAGQTQSGMQSTLQSFTEPLVFSRDVFLLIALYSLVEIPGIAICPTERSNMVLRCL
jgi:hypothetical protein